MRTIREELRAATAEAHEHLDAGTQHIDLSNPLAYGRFLQAQSGPVLALESALEDKGVAGLVPDWPLRSRTSALRHDLDVLGLQPGRCGPVTFKSTPEMFGALYVLEGSRLGARFLVRRVLDGAPELQRATEFLRHGESLRLWQSFLPLLEQNVSPNDLPACARSATQAFSLFEKSFAQLAERRPLESHDLRPVDAG